MLNFQVADNNSVSLRPLIDNKRLLTDSFFQSEVNCGQIEKMYLQCNQFAVTLKKKQDGGYKKIGTKY